MVGFTFSGDDINPLAEELKQYFSTDSKVSIIDDNKYELDLGGYLAEIKKLSVYGGDANSWDVTVSKK